MKLIIDIPFEAYYTFKCDLEKGNLNALAEIIANGTPYEERPQVTVFCENADEETLEDIKKELKKVLDKLKERNNG